MMHDGRFKMIWYPAGNRVQLFDLEADPQERTDLGRDPGHAETRARLTAEMCKHLWGADLERGWVKDGRLVGYDPGPYVPVPDRSWSGQRGVHFPQPPSLAAEKMVGFPQ